LCTDNGAMIAVAGTEAFKRGVRADMALNSDPSWRL
jgi:N6-L-threonylcarbamoyladenine synthase